MRHRPDPPNYFASKYSLPHVVACLAMRGSTAYASVDDSALNDPAIAALCHRVHVTEDYADAAVGSWRRRTATGHGARKWCRVGASTTVQQSGCDTFIDWQISCSKRGSQSGGSVDRKTYLPNYVSVISIDPVLNQSLTSFGVFHGN
jgi:hypothetical protein